jgi:hypothetical protein
VGRNLLTGPAQRLRAARIAASGGSTVRPSPTCPFFRPRTAQQRPSKPAPRPSSNARVAAQRPRSEWLWSQVRNELITDRVHPLPNPLRSDTICFQLEIEPRSSPRPLRVDGFSPINRRPWRRNLPRIGSNPRTRSKRRGHQIRHLLKQLDRVGSRGEREEPWEPILRAGEPRVRPCDAVEAREVQATVDSHLEAILRHIEPYVRIPCVPALF